MIVTPGHGHSDAFLRVTVVCGVALVAITESLGALGLIRRAPVAACWGVVLGLGLFYAARRGWAIRVARRPFRFDPVVVISAAGVAAILALTAVAAVCSPPNSSDAMAYHMPRVLYWAEQCSVRNYPTQYLNQIMMQPLAEYAMLQSYVLTGGDRWVNLVQWFASLGSAVGVACIAARFGADKRGQAMAALFAMTLPAGILASSGAKNDYYMAMWLVAAVYFALRFAATEGLTDALLFGAALGLALLTKATAYLFAPPLVAAVLLGRRGGPRLRVGRGLGAALAVALLLNLPLYVRNYDLSGSVLGSDSAQGDGLFRWRNETFGWRETASNMLRHVSEQLGGRSEKWNRGVYDVVVALHQRLGMDINDPRTTWRWSVYAPPRNANHETNVPNRWHLMLLLVAAGVLAWRARRSPARALYVLGLVAGLVLFCAYLKWQPFQARLLLPLFVLGAPLMGMMGEFGGRKVWIQAAVCLFLLNNARPFLMENWIRPLKGPRSVLHTPRDVQYFADLTFWANRPTYEKTVELLAGWDCARIGIDATHLDLEYPLQALLRERKPGSEFLHTGVTNASARYRQPVEGAACAVVCLDCAGDSEMPRRYSGFPQRVAIDKFVIFGR